eukprot:364495-Chlamydomonas_euryale.AAC.16
MSCVLAPLPTALRRTSKANPPALLRCAGHAARAARGRPITAAARKPKRSAAAAAASAAAAAAGAAAAAAVSAGAGAERDWDVCRLLQRCTRARPHTLGACARRRAAAPTPFPHPTPERRRGRWRRRQCDGGVAAPAGGRRCCV